MLLALCVKRPLLTALVAALVVDAIVGTILITSAESGDLIPDGVKFGFYRTDSKKG